MSFILDALKKSETERQRQSMPGLVDSGVARPRQRLPTWAIALCLLLGINLIVLLVVLVHGWMAPPPAPLPAQAHREPTADGGSPAAESGDRHFSPLDAPQAAPVYAPEIPVPAAGNPPSSPAAGGRQPTLGSASPATHAAPHRRDPVLNNEDYKAADEEVLPSINEINLTGADALPELHLDVHVFATKSSERFVFVNMRKYHEGATLQEGPIIERIRRDGVILNYHGLRFLLPRQ